MVDVIIDDVEVVVGVDLVAFDKRTLGYCLSAVPVVVCTQNLHFLTMH